ncbi:hypothetical protein K2X33_13170 [bacterium]|nr:hypothetical protein [bacterium]
MLLRAIKIGLVAITLVLSACGKNGPVYQAPYPYSTNPGGYGFQPQLPSGYPASYTPFLPLDYFMRNQPQLAVQWPVIWNQWQVYAVRVGVSPYNFPVFWLQYIPMQWGTGPMGNVYSYMNQNFYYWVQPTTTFSPMMTPATFWAPYQGFGYSTTYTYTYY